MQDRCMLSQQCIQIIIEDERFVASPVAQHRYASSRPTMAASTSLKQHSLSERDGMAWNGQRNHAMR